MTVGNSAPSAKNLMLGAGKLFFDRWTESGVKTGRHHLGNAPRFNLTPKIDKLQKFNSMDAERELYAEAVKSMQYTATVEINEFTPFNLALALYGEEGVETQTKKVVTDEIYTVHPGQPLSIPYRNITGVKISPAVPVAASIGAASSYAAVGTPGTATVTSGGTYTGTTSGAYYVTITKANTVKGTVTDAEFTWQKGLTGASSAATVVTGTAQTLAEGVTITFAAAGSSSQDLVAGEIYEIKVTAAGTSYTDGTDFVTDKSLLRAGIVTIPDSTTMTDGEQVKVSYDVPEGKFAKIMGGSVRKVEGDLLFIGDPSMGQAYIAEIWHVSITPTGDIGMIGDDWGSFSLEMSVLADRQNHPQEPFFRMIAS